MRRRTIALALALLAGVLGLAAGGCGGEQTVSPTPSTVQGTVSSPTTTTTATTTPQGPKGDPVAGKAVFTGSAGCTGCHTLKDAGSTGTVGPNLDDAKPDDALVTDRVTNGKGVMPSFKGTLTPQQIADVAAYVSSVAGK
jgi:mono/diheme cytochrome c family protein